MPHKVESCMTLSFPQKLSRLGKRLHDPKWRRYGATLLTGKLAGVGMTLLAMTVISGIFFAKVMAADAPAVKAADIINPVNTMWTLVAALPLPRDSKRIDGMYCRHLPLWSALLRDRLRVYVQPRKRLHRLSLVLPTGSAGHLRINRCSFSCCLDLPVRVC